MERKFANLPGWKRILRSRFYACYLDPPEFKGHISLYCMDAVRAPLVVEYFKRKFCIADAGCSWLRQFPGGEHFTVTAQFDDQARLVMWYIDICLRTGVDGDQIPWMDDLYLDIVVSPEMEMALLDADELLAARESGEISPAEYDLAWREANRLVERIARRQLDLLALCAQHRSLLLEHTPNLL